MNSNIEQMNKHKALVCPVENCGSVRFCLRQDTHIECHECGSETKYLWGIKANKEECDFMNKEQIESEIQIDCDYNQHPVCPYCGQEHEVEDDGHGEWFQDCLRCEREFKVVPIVDVRFSTEKL